MTIYDLMPSIKDLIPYDYEHIRCAEYETVIANFLQNCHRGNFFEQISGAPGAGKTTFCQKLSDKNFLSFDKIMESLPSYQNDLLKYGSKPAFANNEIIARIIGYEILRRAIENKYSLVMEHSGVNNAHLELFTNLRKLHYKTKVDFIICDLNILLERVKLREAATMRHTPPNMVKQRFSLVNHYISKYQAVADEVKVYKSVNDTYEAIN